MIRVLGIDPSYARTGIATPRDTRSITPPPAHADLPPLAREAARRAWLTNRLRPLMAGRDLIAIEGMYPSTDYGVTGRAALLGAITDLALGTGAAVVIVAPASPKILATGNGGPATDKPAMLTAARAAGSPAANGDEADAWWIAAVAELATTTAGPYRTQLGPLPPHRLRALDPYRPPWTPDHPDPWVRHLPDPTTHTQRALGS